MYVSQLKTRITCSRGPSQSDQMPIGIPNAWFSFLNFFFWTVHVFSLTTGGSYLRQLCPPYVLTQGVSTTQSRGGSPTLDESGCPI